MDLMRKILFEIEDKYEAGRGYIPDLEIPDYSMVVVSEHCDLLEQAQLIKGYKALDTLNGRIGFQVGNLTNEGYDFLEKVRDEKTWKDIQKELKKNKLPETIEAIGCMAASILGSFAREYTKNA